MYRNIDGINFLQKEKRTIQYYKTIKDVYCKKKKSYDKYQKILKWP